MPVLILFTKRFELDPAHELTFKLDSGIVSYKNFWDIEKNISSLIKNKSKLELEERTKEQLMKLLVNKLQ